MKAWTKLGGDQADLDRLGVFIEAMEPWKLKRVSGHLRIVRAGVSGKGKRGGARVVLFAELEGYLFYLHCYDRKKKSGLTKAEILRLDALCNELRTWADEPNDTLL